MHAEQLRALDYLARKGTNADTATLRSQVRHAFASAEQAFDEVSVGERERRPAPEKWSAHEILDHLVLSHGPAISQFTTLLEGRNAEGLAIPADLHRDERPAWDELRAQLGDIHAQFLRLMDGASDELSLEPKVEIEMVVKVDGQRVVWAERVDWKAFIQGVRVHTLEHVHQLERIFRNEESSARS